MRRLSDVASIWLLNVKFRNWSYATESALASGAPPASIIKRYRNAAATEAALHANGYEAKDERRWERLEWSRHAFQPPENGIVWPTKKSLSGPAR
jgi:hypothetical protein